MSSSKLLDTWISELKSHEQQVAQDDPGFQLYMSNPESLLTSADPVAFTVGTGAQILSPILHSCESTVHELIIVTCFWAKSSSRDAIRKLLLSLSQQARNRYTIHRRRKIRVRICISSLSICQKLFHTRSLDGHMYPPESWRDLGLPAPHQLEGLDLKIKSIFIRPFSVMHPKFILVDRERAWFPSCNVSWEEWFEGCVELRGPITGMLFDFWDSFWGRRGGGMELPQVLDGRRPPGQAEIDEFNLGAPFMPTRTRSSLIGGVDLPPSATQTALLLSPHHRNPFTTQVPPTPLNTFLLTLIANAAGEIYMQTPNLTCGVVLEGLLAALTRGIDITIVTSRRLMIFEQLVTAGTITEFEIWKLRRKHRRLLASTSDPEAGSRKPGTLKIGYYRPKNEDGEPVKSHLKLTIVDQEVTVLGSGNMDRASWYTSQELGVALFSKALAGNVSCCVRYSLQDRVEWL